MSPQHRVEQGECISSIAERYGHFPETLWEHPENAALKEERGDPNVLCPGDELHIPEIRPRTESCVTDRRHRFVRKGVPAKFRIQLMRDGEPRRGLSYRLVIPGVPELTGETDASGVILRGIPPNAGRGKLFLEVPGAKEEELEFHIGDLDPVDTVKGMQARLFNLGFYDGEIDGEDSYRTIVALRDFQEHAGLDPTGDDDDETLDRLLRMHDNPQGPMAASSGASDDGGD